MAVRGITLKNILLRLFIFFDYCVIIQLGGDFMEKIQIECSEFVNDENGGHIIHYTREQEPLHPERERKLCQICTFNGYPKCLEYCSVGKSDKK